MAAVKPGSADPADADRWQRIAVGLGSNLGEREPSLARAAIAIADHLLAPRVSPLVVSAPVQAPPGSPDFLNAVLVGLCRMAAADLLGVLKALEHRAGRRRAERNAPRPLDCDLLIYGEATSEDRELTLPHPRLRERPFWTLPLVAVASDWSTVGVGAPVPGATEGVRWRRWSRASVDSFTEAGIQVTAPPDAD